jgi:hypothetical protein
MDTRLVRYFLRCTLSLIAAISLLTGVPLFAQAGTGGISGTVTDASGGAVPAATVTVLNPATGVSVESTTTGVGVYNFPSLPPAVYQVTVSKDGYSTSQNSNVTVTVDGVTNLNVTLATGTVSQVVRVTASSELVETSNSTVGQVIDTATISRVPLLTRDTYQLVQLSAGVLPTNGVPNASDTQSIINSRQNGDVAGYTINGALQGTLQFIVDGAPISIAENNLGSYIPATQIPEAAVQEYRVETQNTPANFQTGGAGAISLVTKSGTNNFHGEGFAYIRPDILASNEYFAKQHQIAAGQPNAPVAFHRYQYGASIGGPILHNKLFFFGDYEGTNQALAVNGNYSVPTAAERTGDFSADSFTIYNPFAPDNPDGTRQAFPGNKITNSMPLNPIAVKYAAQYPAPTSAGTGKYHKNNLFTTTQAPSSGQKFDIRMDGFRSGKQHIFGRFSFARTLIGSGAPWGADNIYGPDTVDVMNARNFLLADDISLSPKTLLQLRYSYIRHYENQNHELGQLGFDMTSVGFPAALQAASTFHDVPYVRFKNMYRLGSSSYGIFHFVSQNPYDIVASISTTKGKHSLSAGFEAEKMMMNVGQPVSPSGLYYFDDSATSSKTLARDGSDFASFLLGMGADPAHESGPNWTYDLFVAESSPYYGAFVQDNYRILRNLNVSLGVRWDIFGGNTERHNRLEYWDPNVQYTVNGVGLTGGEQFVGVNGHGRSPFETNMHDIGPRASFAWQVTNKMIVRGGSGMYYGPSVHMIASAGENSDGFGAQTTWNATTKNEDGNTVMLNSLSNPFPDGLIQPVGSSQGPATAIGSTLNTMLHSQRTPVTYNFNLGIENDLPHSIVFSLAYVGSRGRFIPLGGVDLNQLPLSTIGQYQDHLNDLVPNTYEPVLPSANGFAGHATIPQGIALEAYPQFNCGQPSCGVGINGYPGGDSSYDSLQTKVQKRLTSHFTTLASFTWGKLLSDAFYSPLSFVGFQGGVGAQDWRDIRLEKSLGTQDIKYQFNWMTSYDLPVGNGRALNLSGWRNQAFGGWTANTIVYLSTGVPIGAPSTGTADWFGQRVDQVCDPGKGAPHTAKQWFTPACFADPASQYVAGTAPRTLGSVRTAGARDLDASIYKSFTMGGERALRVEMSSYNLTNTAQLGYPTVDWPVSTGDFGQITSTSNTPRQFQFAAKFTF